MKKMTVQKWVRLFKLAGLKKTDMQRWHRLFEKHYPSEHGRFLKWLGQDSKAIKAIRRKFQD